jgi:hypothetical protein
MSISRTISKSAGEVLRTTHAGNEKLASGKLGKGSPPTLRVSSDWFEDGAALPPRFTVDGEGSAPPLRWSRAPSGAKSLVLVCEDPDAPTPEPFVHWLVYGIPPELETLDAGTLARVREGENSKLGTGFIPAAPPVGHGVHHYHFQLFALDTPMNLEEGAGRRKLFEAMRGHVLEWGELVGTYERQ